MPTIDIDLFDDAPKVGDDVKVLGKVESINEETGEVDVSYDDVKIVDKNKKKRKKRRNRDNDNDDDDDMDEVIFTREPAMETMPQSQTLDQALAQSFPMTQ